MLFTIRKLSTYIYNFCSILFVYCNQLKIRNIFTAYFYDMINKASKSFSVSHWGMEITICFLSCRLYFIDDLISVT